MYLSPVPEAREVSRCCSVSWVAEEDDKPNDNIAAVETERRQFTSEVFISKEIFTIDGETALPARTWASAGSTKCNEGRRRGIRESSADRRQFAKSWISINYISSVSREEGGCAPGLGSPLSWRMHQSTASKPPGVFQRWTQVQG